MQFKHPELLYALLLLLIPIIIHLFQLRRFQKVAFTNVAFLKKVSVQTRKSSQIKKWLTLFMRLGAFAAIILAFAQPFSASKTALNTTKETVIYLDNSFSADAKGANGPLLERAKQDLYGQLINGEKISWFTNNTTRKNIAVKNAKEEILKTSLTSKQLTPNEVMLKAEKMFSENKNSDKRLIYISDFQQKEAFPSLGENFRIDAVQLKPISENNISIDSISATSKNGNNISVKVNVSSGKVIENTVAIAIYNGSELIAKTAMDFSENTSQQAIFDIDNTIGFNGKVQITDSGLNYDNTLFFSLNKPTQLKVLSVNNSSSNFLQRLFNSEEFSYTQQDNRNLDFSKISEQDCIILNELDNIPTPLTEALKSFVSNGGSLTIIPSANVDINSYNNLISPLGLGKITELNKQEKKITQIVFDHPIYNDVFETRVVNFQFPKVNTYYNSITRATPILKFEDGKPFIITSGNTYLVTAPINTANSNFTSSPLIVPTFYNIARQSLQLSKLYFNLNKTNKFAVPITISQDEILSIKDSISSYIPLQQAKSNKVLITTTDTPEIAGNYQITKNTIALENVSYNYPRDESVLTYLDASTWENVTTHTSINELFTSIEAENNISEFWKWFVILGLLFLVAEMLLLKFYKR